jgi:hypothetical protein
MGLAFCGALPVEKDGESPVLPVQPYFFIASQTANV